MNKCEKIDKLMKHETVVINITAINLMRIVDGDLSHIGDALLNGETILCSGYEQHRYAFTSSRADQYTIKRPTITLNGIEVPAPFIPEISDKYFFMATKKILSYEWVNDAADNYICDCQPIFATEQDCIDFYAALMKIIK